MSSKSYNKNIAIKIITYIVLLPFFPLLVIFNLIKNSINSKSEDKAKINNLSNSSSVSKELDISPITNNKANELIYSLGIPEPTRSLIWITDEDLSKISSPMSFKISISADEDNINLDFDDGKNFYGEPSLIWTRLPIERNDDLETAPMYYPAYSALSQRHRYQYLNWLRDITQKTNLSYVFLYYYGLERQLLTGNFDGAISEILRLIESQDPKFKDYVVMPLLMALGYKNRLDLLDNLPFLLDDENDLSLWIRSMTTNDLNARNILNLTYHIGFTNKRYIKMYPELFEKLLQNNLNEYTSMHGPLLSQLGVNALPKREFRVFLNTSIPSEIRDKKIPDMLADEEFKRTLFNLLQTTHDQIKESKKRNKLI